MKLDAAHAAPDSWERRTIGEACERITSGGTPSRREPSFYEGGSVPWVKTKELNDGVIFATEELITERALASSSAKLLPAGTILLAMYGATVGMLGVLGKPMACNQACCALIPSADTDRDYLYYQLLAHREQLQGLATGAAQQNLSGAQIKQLVLPFPALDEQKSIGKMLRILDDRITLLRETNATLEAIAQALFKSWFVDFDPVRAKMEGRTPEGMDEATAALFPDGFETSELGEVPKGWRVSRLADVTERITKGTTPTTLKRAFVPSGINFVKAESMTGDGGFIAEKFAFIDSETHALLARSQLQDGDVLISIAGTIGRLAVMTEDFLPANTNQAVALIRPNPDLLPSGLIYRLLRRNESQQKLAEKVVQAVQANLSLGTLSDLKLVVPPPSVVGRIFGAGLEQIDLIRVANDQRIRTLSTLRDTLLPRLISGQLRLPEAQAALESTP